MQKTAILIIEDDGAIGELVVQILAEAGYEPLLVPDLPSAEQHHATQGAPAAILSDLMVRGPDSPAGVIHALTQLFPAVPVALMTGVPAQRRASFGVEHDRIIEKPFDLELLLATVEAMLSDGSSPAP